MSRLNKILFIYQRVPVQFSTINNGVEKYSVDLINQLKDLADVYVVGPSDSHLDGQNVQLVEIPRTSEQLIRGRKEFKYYVDTIWEAECSQNFDYIFIHDFQGSLFRGLSKYDFDFSKFHIFTHTVMWQTFISANHLYWCQTLLEKGAKIWHNSEFTRNSYLNWNFIVPDSRINIKNELFYGEIFPVFTPRNVVVKEAEPIVISIQRIRSDRKPKNLLNIFKSVPSAYKKVLCTNTAELTPDEYALLPEFEKVCDEMYLNGSWDFNQELLSRAQYAVFTKPDESFGLAIAEAHNYGVIPLVVAKRGISPAPEHSPESIVFSRTNECKTYVKRLGTYADSYADRLRRNHLSHQLALDPKEFTERFTNRSK